MFLNWFDFPITPGRQGAPLYSQRRWGLEPAVLQLLGNRTGPGAGPLAPPGSWALSGCWGAGGSFCTGNVGVGSSLHMWWMRTRTRPVSLLLFFWPDGPQSGCVQSWRWLSVPSERPLACPPLALPLGKGLGKPFTVGLGPGQRPSFPNGAAFKSSPLQEVGWSLYSGVHPALAKERGLNSSREAQGGGRERGRGSPSQGGYLYQAHSCQQTCLWVHLWAQRRNAWAWGGQGTSCLILKGEMICLSMGSLASVISCGWRASASSRFFLAGGGWRKGAHSTHICPGQAPHLGYYMSYLI